MVNKKQKFLSFMFILILLLSAQSCVTPKSDNKPVLIYPANGSTNLPFNNLTVEFKAITGLKYDVIVKSEDSQNIYSTSITSTSEVVDVTIPKGKLEPGKKYKWYVRIHNDDSKASSLWTFTTTQNTAPTVSTLKPDGTSDHPFGALALTWNITDPDGDDLTSTIRIYEVGKDVPVVELRVGTDTCVVKNLKQLTQYIWEVEVQDPWGGVAKSNRATFRTKQNVPPQSIELKSPVNNSTDIKFNDLLLQWQGSDPDYEDLKYTIYLYKSSEMPNKPLVSNSTQTEFLVTGLEPLTDYSIDIEAIDTYGESLRKSFKFKTKENTPPQKPTLIEPVDNSRINLAKVNTLSFKWKSSKDVDEDVVSYRFVITDGANSRSMYPLSVTELSFGNLSDFFKKGKRYTWYVEAKDPHGGTTKSDEFIFEAFLNNPPSVPSNPYPSDGAVNLPNRIPQFSWSSSDSDGDSLKYDLYIGKTRDDLKLVASDLATNSYSTPMLFDFGTTYYWKIVVKDGFNEPVEGPVWKFTVTNQDNPPTKPVLISPANGQSGVVFNNIALKWKASTDIETPPENLIYYVYLGKADEMDLVAQVTGQSTNEIIAAGINLKPSTTYYWRVEVKDTFGNYAYSETNAFTTKSNTAPNWPKSPNPADGSTITVSSTPAEITMTWDASDPDGDNLTYEIQISKAENLTGAQVFYTSTRSVKITLDDVGTYYWRVTAKDPHGGSTEGNVWSFEVKK
jgi:hypothetical protein